MFIFFFFIIYFVVEVSIELINDSMIRIDVARVGSPTNISIPLVKPSSINNEKKKNIKNFVFFF